MLVAISSAPGITAPCVSRTSPVISPKVCAPAGAQRYSASAQSRKTSFVRTKPPNPRDIKIPVAGSPDRIGGSLPKPLAESQTRRRSRLPPSGILETVIYTSYEMIRDCREDKPRGWSYFIASYVPVVRRFLAHYFPERESDQALLQRILARFRRPNLFATMEPVPERYFVSE